MGNKTVKFDGDDNPDRYLYTENEIIHWYADPNHTIYTHSTSDKINHYLSGARVKFKYKTIKQDTSNPRETIYEEVKFIKPTNINCKVVYPKVIINQKYKDVKIYDLNDKLVMRIYFKNKQTYDKYSYYTDMFYV